MDIVEQTKKRMQAALDRLKEDLKGLRTGRANPGLVENVSVEVYGTKMRLAELGSITIPESRQILITPFDASNTQAIAKGIDAANLNLLAQVESSQVRIKIPPMDSDTRQKIAKEAKRKCEETKINIRNVRRDSNEVIKKQKSDGDLAEDMMKKLEKAIQEHTDKFCKLADDLTLEKEKELQAI